MIVVFVRPRLINLVSWVRQFNHLVNMGFDPWRAMTASIGVLMLWIGLVQVWRVVREHRFLVQMMVLNALMLRKKSCYF